MTRVSTNNDNHIMSSNNTPEERYNSFGSAIKQEFGEKVSKVNIDAGFTCPNRDGSLGLSGCVYCNNDSFRPSSCKPSLSVGQQVRAGIEYLGRRYRANKFIAYFQPYTNTYADTKTLKALYAEALEEPLVVGLAIGTRPDCVDEEKLSMIEGIASSGKFVLMEYGIQSVYSRSLEFIERGHDYDAFLKAVAMTQGRGIRIGAHLMAGFPTETKEQMLDAAGIISASGVEFLKLHQLQIVSGTKLASMYEKDPFHVFGYDEYLDFVADFIERLSPHIVLQRLFATAPDDILIAPRWGKNRSETLRDIRARLDKRDIRQGAKYSSGAQPVASSKG